MKRALYGASVVVSSFERRYHQVVFGNPVLFFCHVSSFTLVNKIVTFLNHDDTVLEGNSVHAILSACKKRAHGHGSIFIALWLMMIVAHSRQTLRLSLHSSDMDTYT